MNSKWIMIPTIVIVCLAQFITCPPGNNGETKTDTPAPKTALACNPAASSKSISKPSSPKLGRSKTMESKPPAQLKSIVPKSAVASNPADALIPPESPKITAVPNLRPPSNLSTKIVVPKAVPKTKPTIGAKSPQMEPEGGKEEEEDEEDEEQQQQQKQKLQQQQQQQRKQEEIELEKKEEGSQDSRLQGRSENNQEPEPQKKSSILSPLLSISCKYLISPSARFIFSAISSIRKFISRITEPTHSQV